ncbi:MAG: response regulator [Ignavibacteriales bacterium]|nr:response regulator [Ignavibacteriales bacterium]
MNTQNQILVIDDEIQMRRLLRTTLESAGYNVTLAENAIDGIRNAETHRYDAIVLDLGLPDIDGIEVLKKIRVWAQYPIIILSARTSEEDIVTGLDSGANDYLTKPFRTSELLARLRSSLRVFQSASSPNTIVTIKDISIDLDTHMIKKNGEQIKLTPTEFALLTLFVRNAGKVLTHNYILQQVWGPKFEGESQYTRVYVGQLRKKLEDDPNNPKYFITESGIGYRLIVEE